jgi:putative ATP-dependent endonuclease of OLD family
LSDAAVQKLTEAGVENIGDQIVDAQVRSASSNALDLQKCRAAVTAASREALGKAAKSNKTPWFKTVTDMESVGRLIVGPDLPAADAGFRSLIDAVVTWTQHGGA